MRKFVRDIGSMFVASMQLMTLVVFMGFILLFLAFLPGYITMNANGFHPIDHDNAKQMQKVDFLCSSPSCMGMEAQWYDNSWHRVLEVKRGKTLVPLGKGMIVALELEGGVDVTAKETWLLNGARNFEGKKVQFEFKNRGI